MDALETLRELVPKSSPSIRVNLVKPPTYVSVFYSPEEKPSQIIFIYKESEEVGKAATDDLRSNEGDGTPGSDAYEFDITGNPLEDPFEELDNITIAHEKQQVIVWHKSEENHLALPLNEARSLLNRLAFARKGRSFIGQPFDIWVLTKPNASSQLDAKKKRHDVLIGLRHSSGIQNGKLCWFARSVVTFESPCSLGSPQMDPSVMKKEHLELSGADKSVTSKVLSIYYLSGESSFQADSPVSCSSTGSVYLEVKWREPKLKPPLHEALSVMVIEVSVGQSSSILHPLWKQLWTLEKLLNILRTSGKKLKSIDKVPKYPIPDSVLNVTLNELSTSAKLSVREELKVLFTGGISSQSIGLKKSDFGGSIESSVLSNRMTMHKSDDVSKENRLRRSIEQVLSNKRINADATDDLWIILSDCDYFNDLSNAFDIIYQEVKQGRWKPFLRHRNQSRTSALLRAFSNAVNSAAPDLTGFESSTSFFALESIFELGLEKLAHDYIYIFMESGLASRDELLAPTFPRKNLGVSQENWLSTCDDYLTWLTKMHASLEAVLLTEEALTGVEQAFSSVTSQALTYFQGANSPIQSAKFISSNEKCLAFRASVNTYQIGTLLSKPFDLWQLRLTSETATEIIETVFHRSAFQVFPPQILSGGSDAYIPQHDKSSYCSCKCITFLNRM